MERETNLVLQSIFPLQSLGAFVSQPRMDKRTQLRELTAIVTGIREIQRRQCSHTLIYFKELSRYYRVTLVVEYLGWVDLDLGSSQKIKMLQT